MHLPRSLVLFAAVVAGPSSAAAQDVPWKPYGEVIQGAEGATGLFSVYYKRDQVLLGLTPEQFDRDYLLVTQLSQGIGDLGLDGGTSLRSDLIRFHRQGDRVELWVVNPRFAAAPGTPMARAVDYSFGHSVAQAFPIATVRESGERQILFDLTPFLLSDWADVGATLQAVATRRKLVGAVTLDDKRSSLQELRLFPANLEAEVRLTFQSPRSLGLETVSDSRSVPVGVHYSLLELPATPMRPRYADERVGYFISAFKDFSRDTAESFFVRYVNRWRLEKQVPGTVSEPVRPIIYYIDHTVPLEWRPYIRAGILEWNRAFEDAGYRDAIQVLDAPDDSVYSAADARFSTVRWTATNRSVYAVGPTNVDPRTGEILNADILVSAAWIQTWRGESNDYAAPVASVESAFAADSTLEAGDPALLCRFAEGLDRQGTLARALLAARGLVPSGGAAPAEYIGQALKALVMHEVGHTLGLRHNFRGSAGITAAQLADWDYTERYGHGVSVMDYAPPALALDPRRQGSFYSPTIGSYDRWAIAYGYAEANAEAGGGAAGRTAKGATEDAAAWTPDAEINALRAIASRAAEPGHLYATDEDAGFGAAGLDPTVSRYDMTDDPLGWARERVTLIDGLFDSLETRVVAPGEGYGRLRSAFVDLLSDRWYALMVSTKYLGGATIARDHRGDPDARPAFTTVPAERQREALRFVADAGFGEGAWAFPPELLSRLAPDRWRHWGAPGATARADFPVHDWALAQQRSLLARLLDPVALSRIRDAELRALPGESTLGIPEVFETLTRSVWAELGLRPGAKQARARDIGSVRRDVQRLHLNAMIALLVEPAAGTPEDARSLARATLVELDHGLAHALEEDGADLDAYTRAHLADSRERIARALVAQMIQSPTSLR